MSEAEPEYRFDRLQERWIIVAPRRAQRPQAFARRSFEEEYAHDGSEPCPFCPGNEHLTPPEIWANRPALTKPDTSGWRVRVVPNKYPALIPDLPKIDTEFDRKTGLDRSGPGKKEGPDRETLRRPGVGVHEVIIDTPRHDVTLEKETVENLALTLAAYRSRLIALQSEQYLRHVLIFKNAGYEAGASLIHPHTQVIGTAQLPPIIANEVNAFEEFRRKHDHCLLCSLNDEEIAFGTRVVSLNQHHVTTCPYASRVPFEVRIAPRRHEPSFASVSNARLESLAEILKTVSRRLNDVLSNVSYNLILHTAPTPSGSEGGSTEFHWHMELLPRLTNLAGLEWGWGTYLNPQSPEGAAAQLRG